MGDISGVLLILLFLCLCLLSLSISYFCFLLNSIFVTVKRTSVVGIRKLTMEHILSLWL